MNSLKPIEKAYWQEYLDTISESERPLAPTVEASFAGSPEVTDELIDLYLEGKKVAGSSLFEDFKSCGDPLPQVGNYWIALGKNGNPRLILKTVKIEKNLFKDVPEEIAIAEGEGDLSLDHWRKVHQECYGPSLEKWNVSDIDQSTVITEYFEIVYQK